MDAMDILGGLLGGGKSGKSGGSLGGKVLKDLLGGRRSSASPGGSSRAGGSQVGSTANVGSRTSRSGVSLESQAKDLEDLLGVATGGRSAGSAASGSPSNSGRGRQTGGSTSQMRQPPSFQDAGSRYRAPNSVPAQTRTRAPQKSEPAIVSGQEEVLVLVRAMINAAKADGRVGDDEQQAILARVADRSPETISFLRREFAKPIDVREFAWSVPIGLEEKVYMMSLAAIDLDENSEADYLRDLGHGLRLTLEECNEMHRRLGAPTLRG